MEASGMRSLNCPVCDGKVDVPEDALEGELFECGSCGAQLEYYLEGERPKLKMAEEVAEDWGE
ncbi:MAG: sulfonate ABC transporter [Thaumarchaeota archaeon]|nr:sulfonate ABC transporter [Candidatus Calditenuaceae archaeon]MDW8041799.1 sulfonate ABC transporter [Nitrososphaerota archaeon]